MRLKLKTLNINEHTCFYSCWKCKTYSKLITTDRYLRPVTPVGGSPQTCVSRLWCAWWPSTTRLHTDGSVSMHKCGPRVPSSPMNDGCALPTLRWMRSGRAGHASLCVALKQEQLEENELRYVAWGARFCDNISALRDGMRCTESKLTIISCVSRLWPPPRTDTLTCSESTGTRTSLGKPHI